MTEQAKHTPGPWRLGPQHKDGTFAIHADAASIFHVVPFSSSARRAEANARLISAAPDMYEALKRISKATSDGLDHSRDVAVLERCINLAKAVVAKAEGR